MPTLYKWKRKRDGAAEDGVDQCALQARDSTRLCAWLCAALAVRCGGEVRGGSVFMGGFSAR